MPSLTPAKRLARMVEATSATTRYVDLAMQLRRLSVSVMLPKGTHLRATDGTELWVGERSEAGDYPISAKSARASAHLADGAELKTDDGVAVQLRAEVLLSVGGVWDHVAKRYRVDQDGQRLPASRPHVIDCVESQVSFTRRYAGWLDDYKAGRKRVRVLLGFGKRRSGKSVITLLCAIAFLIEVPRIRDRATVGWLIVVSHPERKELDSYLSDLLPSGPTGKPVWYTYQELPFHEFRFIHGVSFIYKSTDHDPESLRAGICDLACMSEAAKQQFEGFKNCLRGTTDAGGLVLMAANKAARAKGEWVIELGKQIDAHKKFGTPLVADYLDLDPALNPAIDHVASADIDAIIRALRPEQADEGALEFINDRAYSPPFDETVHVVPAPTAGLDDITREVTKLIVGRPYDFIAGADFQYDPHQVAVVFKIFGTLDAPIMWALENIYAPLADENELIDELEDAGFTSSNTLVIGDASGETQGALRTHLTSYTYFRNRGWNIVPPTPKRDPRGFASKNPNVEKTLGKVHVALKEPRGTDGKLRAIMVDPACRELITSLVKCALKRRPNGSPYSVGWHAHAGDAFRYPWVWLLENAHRYAKTEFVKFSRRK